MTPERELLMRCRAEGILHPELEEKVKALLALPADAPQPEDFEKYFRDKSMRIAKITIREGW